MKHIFSALLFVIVAFTSFSQAKTDSSKHLSFKGVPIDGKLTDYVVKMKQAGFIYRGANNGVAVLEGDFASYKNCTVGVITLKPKDLVSKIGVMFPKSETWSLLSSNYFSLKEMLTEKYGTPTESSEEFQSHTPEDDGSKMIQVELGACKYYTTYETEKGTIQLSIEHDGMTSCFVKLAYFDKINGDMVKKEAMDDL